MFKLIFILYVLPTVLLPIIIIKMIRGDFKRDITSLYKFRKYSLIYLGISIIWFLPFVFLTSFIVDNLGMHKVYVFSQFYNPMAALLCTIITVVAVLIYSMKNKTQ